MTKTLHTGKRLLGMLAVAALAFGQCNAALAGDGKQTQFKLEKGAEFLPNVLVVKMKPGSDIYSLGHLYEKLKMAAPKRMFPRHQSPTAEQTRKGFVDLSRIYVVNYAANTGMEDAVNLVQRLPQVEYVCPKYIYKTTIRPNDPLLSQQTHLSVIGVFQAWDIYQGDTAVSIGIVDSGVDWDHPDLIGNLQYNRADPIDGVDNDADGYVDNYRGWDMGGADFNNPTEDNNPDIPGANNAHGTHVAGICAAHTNNGIGVAGIGFRCRYLPIKCAADNDTRAGGSGYIIGGYEGITYAADHGCQVINCSWGGTGNSQLGADIVNYAQINKNSLVVAAAGNNNTLSDAFYPASYPGVLSVAALNDDDTKAGFSNFGNLVGIAAPGVDVLATYFNGQYAALSGTSMASPVIAGAAALIRAKYPTMTPEQVKTILQSSSQDVTPSNTGFPGQLGSGRLNLPNALSYQGPGVKMTRIQVTDGNDNFFQGRDTLNISGLFRNLLFPSTPNLHVRARLTTSGARWVPGTDTVTLGYMGTLDSVNTFDRPFKIVLNAVVPVDLVLTFKLEYTDTAGTWSEFFNVVANASYANFTWNNISSTAVSTGRIGYAKPDQGTGQGIRYKGSNSLIYETGMMMGSNATNLSNAVRNDGTGADNHFSRKASPMPIPPSVAFAPLQIRGVFSDANNVRKYGVSSKYEVLGFGGVADTNYFVQIMTVQNTSAAPWNNFYVGYFTDTDISPNGQADRGNFDDQRNMGYIFDNTPGGLYHGISVIAAQPTQFWAIENAATAADSIGVYDGYTMAEKYKSLSSGIGPRTAGYNNTPGMDVSFTIGAGPYTVPAGDSLKIAFAFMVGKDLASLQTAADHARTNIIDRVVANKVHLAKANEMSLLPNPGKDRVTIRTAEPILSATILDPAGKAVAQLTPATRGTELTAQIASLNAGMYMVSVRTASGTLSRKFVKE